MNRPPRLVLPHRLFLLPFLLIAILSATAHAQPAPPARRPNVVLIITDDQGYGDLGCMGNSQIRTPHIDRLAGESTRFTRFYVSPVCSPTRSSLLTGRYTYRTGVVDTFLGRSMMHADETTLAEVLRGAGYRTGIFGKWHLGDGYPLRPIDQGFDESLVHLGGGIGQPSDPPGSSYTDPILFHNGVEKKFAGYCTDVYGDAALRFIEQNRETPFFVYFATNAPHTPLQVPDEWVKPYREQGLDDTTAKVYAMVENIDRNVGRLLEKLEQFQLAENTILLYMHDNGNQQRRFNGGLRGLKGTVYEGGIRSPLFVRWKGRSSPLATDLLAAHIDVMPTLLELCTVPKPAGVTFDGMSFAPAVLGHKLERVDRTLFLQWHRGDEPVAFQNAAAVKSHYKLVNGKELYDLLDDPGETKDVASQHPDVVTRLRKEYEAWFADVTAARRFDPAPRIVLGSPKQNPVTLTRQDWRGPKAGWQPNSIGHWDVSIATAGSFDVTLRFPPSNQARTLRLSIAGVETSAHVPPGTDSHRFPRLQLPSGNTRLEAALIADGQPVGVHYVDVHKVD